MKVLARILLGIVIAGMSAWGAGAVYYSPLLGQNVRTVLALFFISGTVLAFLLLHDRRRTLVGFLVVFAVLVVLFFQIQPSNDRDWQPEVAVTPYAVIKDDLVTIHGVSHWEYWSGGVLE